MLVYISKTIEMTLTFFTWLSVFWKIIDINRSNFCEILRKRCQGIKVREVNIFPEFKGLSEKTKTKTKTKQEGL